MLLLILIAPWLSLGWTYLIYVIVPKLVEYVSIFLTVDNNFACIFVHMRKCFWGIIARSGIARSKRTHYLSFRNAIMPTAVALTDCRIS